MRHLILAALLLLGSLACAPASAAKRVALVIGNGDYRTVERLQNPVSDARLIAATLKQLGFTLVGDGAKVNLDKAGLAQAVQEFGRALVGADVALFYFSGHGLQVQGVNWLVPVDANPTRTQDLDFQMVDADLVLRQMEGAGTRLNILILDACRNNPFAVRGLRAIGGGLAEMRAPEGTLISYATQPGSVARDGDGANSPYTEALAGAMRQPGLDIFRTFNQVGLQVKRATHGEQQPWVSNSPIDGDFAFSGAPVQSAGLVQPVPPPAAPTGPERQIAPCPPSRRVGARALRPQLPVEPVQVDPGCPTTPVVAVKPVQPVQPAQPPKPRPVATVADRPAPARPSRCADVIDRLQLGEPLTASERGGC